MTESRRTEPESAEAVPGGRPDTDGARAFRAVLALPRSGATGRRGGDASARPAADAASPPSPLPGDAADGFGIGVDTAGDPIAVNPNDARCLLVRDANGWRAAEHSTAESRAVLDLYLPVRCHSGAVTVAHLGQSLDGQIATASGDSYYVTGPANLLHLHRMRALCDAVVVGAGTVEADDPRLTVRLTAGAAAVRVVLDPRRRLGTDRRVFSDDSAPTLLIADETLAGCGERHGQAEVVGIPARGGRLVLEALLDVLHRRGLAAVFVEGGGTTVSRFLEAKLLDRLQVAIAPLVIGAGRPGLALPGGDRISDCLRTAHRVFQMGADVLIDCDLRRPADGEAQGTEPLRVL